MVNVLTMMFKSFGNGMEQTISVSGDICQFEFWNQMMWFSPGFLFETVTLSVGIGFP